MKMWQKLVVLAIVVAAAAGYEPLVDDDENSQPIFAIADIKGPITVLKKLEKDNVTITVTLKQVKGNVTFTQMPGGKVHVNATIEGLTKGEYGFHVHEFGDITQGCMSTGSHFNPHHNDHGSRDDQNRHIGDLGNVEFNDQNLTTSDFYDTKIALSGPNCILGRAVVLHEKKDDFRRWGPWGGPKKSDGGARVACGVIGIRSPVSGCRATSAGEREIRRAGDDRYKVNGAWTPSSSVLLIALTVSLVSTTL